MGWQTYALVGMIVMHTDAILCFATKRRFRGWPSLIAAMCWPVVIPVAIIGAAVLTRNMPRTSATPEDRRGG
jgi:ABC-type spermidine/putrescine transport system permease subunit II